MSLSVMYRNEKSQYGFSLDVLKSAIQKYIRRNNKFMASYILREFFSFRELIEVEIVRVKSCNTNMFHRLQIISLEDIGPSLLPYIETIDKLLNELKDVTYDERKAFSAGLQFINI